MINKCSSRIWTIPTTLMLLRSTSMIFINNKYTSWYYSIINNAANRTVNGYTERHHIIPKSLGGDNTSTNLIRLTAREHFMCHRLLIKMTTGNEKIKMLHALGMFAQCNPLQKRIFNSREYELIRKAIIEARTGTKRPGIGGVKKGSTPWNKGMTGVVHSDESNYSRSVTMKNKPNLQCPNCNKMGKGNVMFRFHFTNCKNKS